jgi:hypothetical protein
MITKDEAIQKAIDFLDGSYAAHAVRKALQEALAQPAWQGLTDDELTEIIYTYVPFDCSCNPSKFARAIEQALKEKNI